MKHPLALVILDGWGHTASIVGNAIVQAQPPFFNHLIKNYPHTFLKASGTSVGLLENMPGNSAVGHLTIGNGKIIEQPVAWLSHALEDGSLAHHAHLTEKLHELKNAGKNLHIIGLLSDGGVHGLARHIYGLMNIAHSIGIRHIFIHAILDGRDVAPQSAKKYLEHLEHEIQKVSNNNSSIHLATLHGRFYAMDRDLNWERTERSYKILTHDNNQQPRSWYSYIDAQYAQGITDEFIEPVQLIPHATLHDDDGVIFTNIRADRARQLVALLTKTSFERHMSAIQSTSQKTYRTMPHVEGPTLAWCITGIQYHPDFPTYSLYQWPTITNTLIDELAQRKKTIFAIAETEKYAHVTYFFNGNRETIHPREERVMIQSLGLPSYADAPEMSARTITNTVMHSLTTTTKDFYLINYANADMVGHSGNFEATKKAITFLDHELERLVTAFLHHNGTVIITADHGKAEEMIDAESKPKTAHTTNLVPFIVISNKKNVPSLENVRGLCDVKGYILSLLKVN